MKLGPLEIVNSRRSASAEIATLEREVTDWDGAIDRIERAQTTEDLERALMELPGSDRRTLEKRISGGEVGTDGESWYGDVIGGGPDINPELTGSRKYEVYDEMRKTDPAVRSLLWFFKLPIRGARWGLVPASEDPLDKAVCDFVAWNLGLNDQHGELDLSWDESLQQALLFLDWGAMFEELVWDEVRPWRDDDGDEHLVLPLARLAPRQPATVEKVKRDKRGQIEQLKQWTPGSSPIPGAKLTYFVAEREGRRWEGTSVLRPAWGPWRLKKALLVAAGMGWDRFASGIPVVWHPDTPDGKKKAGRIGQEVRQHERGYLRFPGPKEHSPWGFDLVNAASTLADPTPLLRHYNSEISDAGLQAFSRLGTTAGVGLGGSGAAEVQIDPFYMAVEAFAHYVRRQRAREVIRRLVEVNFGAEVAERSSPKLTVSKIQVHSIAVVAQALAAFADAGITFTDREAVDDCRELLGFSKLPEELETEHGIDLAQLEQILRDAGLDDGRLQEIIAALPPEVGLARNRVPPALQREGGGLVAA